MKIFKNCPCCGSSSIYLTFEVNDIGTTIPVVFCNSCKIVFKVENDSPYLNDKETYKYLEEKTIEAWNTRKPLERVIERLEKEKSNLTTWAEDEAYKLAINKAIEIIKEEVG